MSRHSWEDGPSARHQWEVRDRHSWEDVAGAGGASDSDAADANSDSDFGKGPPPNPGEMFFEFVTDLYFRGVLSARNLCVLCWWAKLSGLTGPATECAYKPDAAMGSFQRHLNRVLGFNDADAQLYEVPIIGHSRHDLSRSTTFVPMLPPHEIIHREISETPELRQQLEQACRSDTFAENYWGHSVTKRFPKGSVFPLSLYIDGVPYSATDSIIGVWIINMISGARFLCGVLRKRHLCKCGCKHWCSLHGLFQFLNWSLSALASATWPVARHDGESWRASDTRRESVAGTDMNLVAAVIHLKGDWAEFCSSLGFPTWADNRRPCLRCSCHSDTLWDWSGSSLLGLRYPETTQTECDKACDACERWVTIGSAAALQRFVSNLKFDKRKTGSKGRALVASMPEYGLESGDRLEPHPLCCDVASVDNISVFPARILCWKPSAETVTRHRCPLFNEFTGITCEHISVDVMHTLHLGVLQVYCRTLIWRLIAVNAFEVQRGVTDDERTQLAVLQLRNMMWNWYRERAKSHPLENLTRLNDLTVKMIGSRTRPRLKAKAAETWSFLLFSESLAVRFTNVLGPHGQLWVEAARSLIGYIETCKTYPVLMPPAAVQDSPAAGLPWTGCERR